MTIQRQDYVFPALTSQAITQTAMDGAVPFNLTGFTVLFKLASQPGIEALLQKTTNAGVVVPVPANGTYTVNLANGDVTDSGLYFYTVDATKNDGTQIRLYEGRIAFKPSPLGLGA